MDATFKDILEIALNGGSLTEQQAESAFTDIMSGTIEPLQIAAFLAALRTKGETVSEITGAARVMRAKAASISAPEDAVDTAGTGGDGLHSYNISTAAALVAAASGVPVAKHGNKAVSSKSGSADVLSALGISLDLPAKTVEACIKDVGIGFLFAAKYHAAMANVAPIRKALGTRTIFNILGPLSNPAGAKRQVIGVYDPKWLEPLAEVAGRLGGEKIWVVHGADGLDELSTTGVSYVAEWSNNSLTSFTMDASDYGLPRAKLEDLRGGDAIHNAKALKALAHGEPGPYRDIVLLNAAAAILVGGKASTLEDGISQAAAAIDEGRAAKILKDWAAYGSSDDRRETT